MIEAVTTQAFDPEQGKRVRLLGAWSLLLVAVCMLWVGWHWPAFEQGTFAAGLARGQVQRVEPSSGRRRDRSDLLIGYTDTAGVSRTTLEPLQAGRFQVGDAAWVVYVEGSPERAHMNASMPLMIVLAMVPGLFGLAFGLGLLAHTLRRHAQRRRALAQWTRMDVHEPRIRLRSMNTGARFGNGMTTWRLQARLFDPSSRWRDVHSDWAGSARVPDIGTGSGLKLLLDPDDLRHYWLPLPIA